MAREIKDTDIVDYDPRQHARLRPKLYVGGVNEQALHNLIYKTIDNSVEEAIAGRCDLIRITLFDENEVRIEDNGLGVSVEINQDTGLPELEIFMTFVGQSIRNSIDQKPYRTIGGLRDGMGLSVVNALSAEMKVETIFKGYRWSQSYRTGYRQTAIICEEVVEAESKGLTITFRPDFTIFQQNTFSYTKVAQKAQELSFLVKGLAITLRDERVDPTIEETYYSQNGLIDLIKNLSQGKKVLLEPLSDSFEIMLPVEGKAPYRVVVNFGFQYIDSVESIERSYVNTVETSEGGGHILALRSAIAAVINLDGLCNPSRDEVEFSPNEISCGLVVVVNIFHQMPVFESPTKLRLYVPAELYGAVSQAVYKTFHSFMEDRDNAQAVIKKCKTNRKALQAMNNTEQK